MSRPSISRPSILVLACSLILFSANASAQDTAAPPPAAPAPTTAPPVTAPATARPTKPPAKPPAAPAEATEATEAEAEAPPPGDTPSGSPSYVETVPAEQPSEAASDTRAPATTARPRHRPRPPAGAYPAAPPEYGGPSWPTAPPPPPRTERRSTGMMVAGIVLTSVGALGLVVGGVLISQANNDATRTCVAGPCDPTNEDKRKLGIGVAVVGLASLGVGIPLLVIGARKVPVEQQPTAWQPRLELGPTSGRLTWSF